MKIEEYNPKGFAEKIFKDRYAIHPEETFQQACERVARVISDAESGTKRDEYFSRFLDVMQTNRFSPGGRIWRGAGRPRGQMILIPAIPFLLVRQQKLLHFYGLLHLCYSFHK